MNRIVVTLAGLLALAPVGAQAQSLGDDVQCLMLSNAFSHAGSNDKARSVAAMTAAFYLGRLDGRASPADLKAAMMAQKPGMAAAAAGKAMQGCAVRANAANARVATVARQLHPPK